VGSAVFSGLIVVQAPVTGPARNWLSGMAAFTNGFQASIGLLLLSVASATALAEERVRGSLDVLLVTPLSTRTIVWGKWWGVFRSVPLLCGLPFLVCAAMAIRTGRWIGVVVLVLNILAFGAAVTSLGLALATWMARLGRAVALTVSAYVLVTVGWLFLAMALWNGRGGEYAAMASPFFGPGNLTFHTAENQSWSMWSECLGWGSFWTVFFAAVAIALFVLTLFTFNRCLGRVDERGVPRLGPSRKPVLEPELVFERT
jgi:ABC-type transport system involved in multi-copper enzyme maturation permease subunit